MSNTKLIPKLRFPEFEDDGEWVKTTLDEEANYANGKAHEKEISANGKYKVVNSKFISTDGEVVKFTDSANLRANIGDILMVLSDIPNGKAIAKCFYVDKEDTYTVNQRICKVTAKTIDNKFLFYIQNRNRYFLAFDDGVKQTNLRKDTILAFPFQKPQDPLEQQKIASCLSSLDELIAAHRDKLSALKDHKKGLMQNLFPNSLNHDFKGLKDDHDLKTGKKSSNQVNQKNQGSDNVPNYRFPEFEGDGEWVKKKLGNAADFINGRAYKKEELLTTGKYRVLRVGNFFTNNQWYYSDLELEENKYCEKGDLLYAWSASFGPRIWKEEKVIYHYHIWKVIEKKEVDRGFLFVLLDFETENIKAAQSRGLGMQHLTKSGIESWESTIPPSKEEQQKIASCLSAVDELITAQQDKIEQLLQHKKGLMQGMFPEPSRRMFPGSG